jgi:hypothetical protein
VKAAEPHDRRALAANASVLEAEAQNETLRHNDGALYVNGPYDWKIVDEDNKRKQTKGNSDWK